MLSLFFARESVPSETFLGTLFKNFLIKHDDKNINTICLIKRKHVHNPIQTIASYYHDVKDLSVLSKIKKDMEIGDIVIASTGYCENALSFNGNDVAAGHGFKDIRLAYDYYYTDVYKKDPMEMFSKGPYSVLIMYDSEKDCIYEYNNTGEDMSHGYIRGIGFIIHTDLQSIRESIQLVCHTARDGMNLWENWYGHPLEQNFYREIDCDSGFMRIVHCPKKNQEELQTKMSENCSLSEKQPGGITKMSQNCYVFDFDGTLVKQTKFVDSYTNLVEFLSFKSFINPDAFEIKWGIVTNRPRADRILIDNVLRTNNMNPSFIYTHESFDNPPRTKQEQVDWKISTFNELKTLYPEYNIVYVDNDEKMRKLMGEYIESISVIDFINQVYSDKPELIGYHIN